MFVANIAAWDCSGVLLPCLLSKHKLYGYIKKGRFRFSLRPFIIAGSRHRKVV